MEIKPMVCSSEQTKKFKEKGFKLTEKVTSAFSRSHVAKNFAEEVNGQYSVGGFDNDGRYYNVTYNKEVVITKIEHWQAVEWLRVKHGIVISVYPVWNNISYSFYYDIVNLTTHDKYKLMAFDSSQEAYSAAFDYVLKELI